MIILSQYYPYYYDYRYDYQCVLLVRDMLVINKMLIGRQDSYYYSRPVSYVSYTPRLVSREVLPSSSDPESEEVLRFLQSHNLKITDQGGLSRGIRFDDLEVGRRAFNHNRTNSRPEYYISQWKNTNNLPSYHRSGINFVTNYYNEFANKLQNIIESQKYRL